MTEKMKWANPRAIFMVEMGMRVILYGFDKKLVDNYVVLVQKNLKI